MSLSARAHYACVALLELARQYAEQPDTPMTVQAICQRHGMSHPFLRQILNRLRASGLVQSARGAGGGYTLARPPEQISLKDVLDALGESWQLKPDDASLTHSPARTIFQQVWQDINKSIATRLAQLHFASLAQEYRTQLEQSSGEPDWVI